MKKEQLTKDEIFEKEQKNRLKTIPGRIDFYLLENEKYTQEERELIMDFLYGGILQSLGIKLVKDKNW